MWLNLIKKYFFHIKNFIINKLFLVILRTHKQLFHNFNYFFIIKNQFYIICC